MVKLSTTNCFTIDDKVFGVIIDSGKCENIVGKETLKKLDLLVEKHPNPYTLR